MHHPIVEFKDVSYTYGEGAVLDHVSLTIPEGAFVGVVGPSGAGKTTMLKLISGTTKPAAGSVQVGSNRGKVRLAVVPQIEAIDWNFPVTVEEVVLLGRAADRRLVPWAPASARAEEPEILDKLRIGQLAHRHIRHLSGCLQPRAFLPPALLPLPQLLRPAR